MKLTDVIFRGRLIDSDKWVYGYYFSTGPCLIKARLGEHGNDHWGPDCNITYDGTFQIKPDTLEVWKGKLDDRGLKILELSL